MRWKSHVQCRVGENLEITSNSYLSRWYQLAKKKKLKGARCVAYVAGYTAINSINPFKVIKKAAKKTYRGYLKAKCKITKKGCFVEGTLVLTEDGLVPIEDIEVGNYVWAENPDTGDITLKEVLDTFEKKVDTIVTITIDGEKIQTTEAHLFYVENTVWIPASMLQEGDSLSLEDGREVPIQSIKIVDYNYYIFVYNFEVEDFHTYYVSDISVLTHNMCAMPNIEIWNKGSFESIMDSLEYHYKKHGKEVGANSMEEYLRKAKEFAKTAKKRNKGRLVKGKTVGTKRYSKNGKYIDLTPNGDIVSFGRI